MSKRHPDGRPCLNLKPRDPEAAKKAEAEREAKLKASPYGSAKPREQTLASRTGKTEEEVLREAIKSERLRLRLNAQQQEEKQQLDALVEEVKEQLAMETEEPKRAALTELLKQREAAVDALLDKFSHAALEAAQRGDIQRPSERRMMQQLAGGHDGLVHGMTDLMYGGGGPPQMGHYGVRGGRGGPPGYGGGGRGSGGGGYNPTRDHQLGSIGGNRGWGSAPVDDGYLPGIPPPPGLPVDPSAIDYHSPFPSRDRY